MVVMVAAAKVVWYCGICFFIESSFFCHNGVTAMLSRAVSMAAWLSPLTSGLFICTNADADDDEESKNEEDETTDKNQQ